MADSDDEYDKKRRDKFQGERTESYRDRRKDDDWGRGGIRSDYRDRYSYQNDVPPAKRIRYENDDVRNMRFQPPFNVWGSEPSFGGGGGFGGNARSSDLDTQPPIMTFKSFLQTQDDNITDEEAISKYAEYKLEFRRQQLNEFFVAHKEEECTNLYRLFHDRRKIVHNKTSLENVYLSLWSHIFGILFQNILLF
uniref:Serrate RNA effector molecule n=1 Tax=Lygus hesperus TaxID=30085 RepID=A0A146M7S6_LYGHE